MTKVNLIAHALLALISKNVIRVLKSTLLFVLVSAAISSLLYQLLTLLL